MNARASTSIQIKFMLYCITTKISVNALKIVRCLFGRFTSVSFVFARYFSSIHSGRWTFVWLWLSLTFSVNVTLSVVTRDVLFSFQARDNRYLHCYTCVCRRGILATERNRNSKRILKFQLKNSCYVQTVDFYAFVGNSKIRKNAQKHIN